MILRGDHQAPHGHAAGGVAVFVFLEQFEQTCFEVVEGCLADAFYHGIERYSAFADQLAQITFGHGGESCAQLRELRFADARRAVLVEPAC